MELHSSVCSSCRAHSKAHRQKRKTTGCVICQSFRIFNFESGSVPASVAVTMESAVTVPLPAAPAIAIVVVRSVMIPVTAPAVSIPAPAIATGPAVKTPMPVRPVIPRPRADKHAADEPIGTVIAVRRASVRIIAVVSVGAYWRRPNVSRANSYANDHPLCACKRSAKQANAEQSCEP